MLKGHRPAPVNRRLPVSAAVAPAKNGHGKPEKAIEVKSKAFFSASFEWKHFT
jgi:hypothetical protein